MEQWALAQDRGPRPGCQQPRPNGSVNWRSCASLPRVTEGLPCKGAKLWRPPRDGTASPDRTGDLQSHNLRRAFPDQGVAQERLSKDGILGQPDPLRLNPGQEGQGLPLSEALEELVELGATGPALVSEFSRWSV